MKISVHNQIKGTVNAVVAICRGTTTPSKQISPWNR